MSHFAQPDAEIDLAEIFSAICRNFWIVLTCVVLGMSFAIYYAFVASTPEYRSIARFELLEESNNLNGGSNTLAAFAGVTLGGEATEADKLEDRVLARPFVEKIYDRAGFINDPIFNGALAKPKFIDKLRAFVFGPQEALERDRQDFVVSALGGLKKRLLVNISDNGFVELSILHPNAERSAQLANIVVEQAIADIFERKKTASRERISHFAGELLQVREQLDQASAALNRYAVDNSFQPAGTLARTASQLSQLRDDLKPIEESLSALRILQLTSSENFDGADFSRKLPITTSLDFRRLMRWAPTPSQWVLPSESILTAALESLLKRRQLMTSSIAELEEQARLSADDALQLSGLEREVQVQTALYESLITQFETQSVFTGFEQDSGRIIESAIAGDGAAKPNKLLILVVGTFVSGLVGVGIVLLKKTVTGTVYSSRRIIDKMGIEFIVPLRNTHIPSRAKKALTKKQFSTFGDIAYSLNRKHALIAVLNAGSPKLQIGVSVALCKAMSAMGRSVAILDLTGDIRKNLRTTRSDRTLSGADILDWEDKVQIISLTQSKNIFDDSEAEKIERYARDQYDVTLVLGPTIEQGAAYSIAAEKISDDVLVLAQNAHTKASSLDRIKGILNKGKIDAPILLVAVGY